MRESADRYLCDYLILPLKLFLNMWDCRDGPNIFKLCSCFAKFVTFLADMLSFLHEVFVIINLPIKCWLHKLMLLI